MSKQLPHVTGAGPFLADQIRPGDPYELSNGHPIECMPTGGRGSRANLVGASVLETDPEVESAGVDTGFALTPGTLRAPDVAVGNVPDTPGWVRDQAPPLAVEYADTGQDEAELKDRITDLLAAGTRVLWVVRLTGPRRVEVHTPGAPMRVAYPGEVLAAPGILRNAVPVAALFDRDAAHEATLTNLLQRKGYRDLDQVRDDARAQGESAGSLRALRESLALILDQRGLAPSPQQQAAIAACTDAGQLRAWLTRAITAPDLAAVFVASLGR